MKFPKKVFLYINEVDGEAVLLAAREIDDIPEDYHGTRVATYKLKRTEEFRVRRILK
jgi:hypothetical protein